MDRSTFYVSPEGNDRWHGHLAEPAADGCDGPLATIREAVARIRHAREQRHLAGEATIRVAAGRYATTRPLEFGTAERGIRVIAEPGAVLDGSALITNWATEEVNGHPCWVADVGPLLLATPGTPRSLFVDDKRRPRSRYPKADWLTIADVPDTPPDFELADGSSRFVVDEGDFDPAWRNPTDIEAIVNHLWTEERMPVAAYDPQSQRVTSSRRSIFTLRNKNWMGDTPCAKYFWENVFEAMSEPGEWYLDRVTQRLYYLPKPGETIGITEVRLGVLTQLVRVHGDGTGEHDGKAWGVHLEGLTFANTDWRPSEGWGRWWDPEKPEHEWRAKDSYNHFNRQWPQSAASSMSVRYASVPQAAHDLPGVVSFELAEGCALLNCAFRGLGFYAVDVGGGCRQVRVERCRFDDIGGGGVKIDGADQSGDPHLQTSHVYVGDCMITRCGRVTPSAVGVAILHASNNTVEYNEIADQFYSGISVGWTWGFEQAICQRNVIQYNHIHHLGQGRLSDMGGIYTLGVQPGTILRGNHIHHVESGHYGGWGIYLDEGSSFIRVEGNVVHHTGSQAFNEHWGRQNVVVNNIFALTKRALVQLVREEHGGQYHDPPPGLLFMRNVLLSDGGAMFNDVSTYFDADLITSDLNVVWDRAAAGEPTLWNYEPWPKIGKPKRTIGLEETRQHRRELHSVVIDPLFADPDDGDFRVAEGSPLPGLGIELPDVHRAGPREAPSAWTPTIRAVSTVQEDTFTD
ncbi:MAG: right-handed parallel beta-helix repeat-containing protein [Planctomycetota bacterium]